MATTTPHEFSGTPTLSPWKTEMFKEWYENALASSDKIADVEEGMYELGRVHALEDVLLFLHEDDGYINISLDKAKFYRVAGTALMVGGISLAGVAVWMGIREHRRKKAQR